MIVKSLDVLRSIAREYRDLLLFPTVFIWGLRTKSFVDYIHKRYGIIDYVIDPSRDFVTLKFASDGHATLFRILYPNATESSVDMNQIHKLHDLLWRPGAWTS